MRLLPLAFVFAACGDDSSPSPDADDGDTSADTGGEVEVDTGDVPNPEDSADSADTAVDDADVPTDVDEHGFHIRVPQVHVVPMEDYDGTTHPVSQSDLDYVCRLDIDGVETFFYMQADPVSCRTFGGCLYDVNGAFVTRAGATNVPITGVGYDYGGNHHNDFIKLPSDEGTLKVYHSSFGFGFRACQPPDCVQVLDGAAVIDDGCTVERTRPAACVRIADDGSEPPLPESFTRCPGDPNDR